MLETGVGSDAMGFELRWAAIGGEAELSSLIDNERPVTGGPWVGTGSITVGYEAEQAPQHVIRWTLNFVGRTLTSLEAFASKNDEGSEKIGGVDEKKTRWVDQGPR